MTITVSEKATKYIQTIKIDNNAYEFIGYRAKLDIPCAVQWHAEWTKNIKIKHIEGLASYNGCKINWINTEHEKELIKNLKNSHKHNEKQRELMRKQIVGKILSLAKEKYIGDTTTFYTLKEREDYETNSWWKKRNEVIINSMI